jgi:hypothetical protein
MFCTSCGTEFHPNDRFCLQCGTLLREHQESDSCAIDAVSTAASPESPGLSAAAILTAPIPMASPIDAEADNKTTETRTRPGSYASLIGLLLVVVVCSSSALLGFVLVSKVRMFGATLLFACQFAVAALAALWFLLKKWKQIRSNSEDDQVLRNLGIAMICIEIMFLGVAAGMGMQLGSKRALYIALMHDWSHLEEVGQRISDKRNHVEEQQITAYLEMYQSIAGDVKDLQQITTRLLEEEQHYQAEYPEYGPNATKEIGHLRITLKRASLLQQQIQIAAKMSTQDEQTQLTTWRSEMFPVLEQEDALDRKN